MTHDSCSYIVSAVPLPFIKQYHSPPHSGISVLSLFYLNAGLSFSISYSTSLSFFSCFWASSKVLFPFTFSSCLTSPVWLVQICLSSRRCLAEVREVGFGGGRLQDGAEVDSRRTAENLTSTHVRMTLLPKYSMSKTKKFKKKSKARWWKNYMPKPRRIQKIPPKPCRHSSPMHYKWVATLLPYGFHMKHDVSKRSS